MPHCIDSVEAAVRRDVTPQHTCVHQYVRVEKWKESETTEYRDTDDFGKKGPRHRKRMTTVYEKYRCPLCGAEDTQSYTTWETLLH